MRELKNISREFFNNMTVNAIYGYVKKLQNEIEFLKKTNMEQQKKINNLNVKIENRNLKCQP